MSVLLSSWPSSLARQSACSLDVVPMSDHCHAVVLLLKTSFKSNSPHVRPWSSRVIVTTSRSHCYRHRPLRCMALRDVIVSSPPVAETTMVGFRAEHLVWVWISGCFLCRRCKLGLFSLLSISLLHSSYSLSVYLPVWLSFCLPVCLSFC